MKNTITAFLLGLLFLFACNNNNDWSDSSQISYKEAQELEFISFEYEGEVYEPDSIQYKFQRSSNRCPEECGDDKEFYNKGYSVNIGSLDSKIFFSFSFNLGMIFQEELVNQPLYTKYFGPPRPIVHEFFEENNIEESFLTEGTWLDGDRYVHTSLRHWDNDSTNLFREEFLNDNDEFEVTEIQKIRWKANTFLVSGIFNIVFSDDRDGIPANEREETKILSNGTFSVIVEPTELYD